MNSIAVVNPVARALPAGASFEEKLMWLRDSFGQPRVYCHDDGTWSVHIKLSVSVVGAQFEVRSDFGCATPAVAMDQMMGRLKDVIERAGK